MPQEAGTWGRQSIGVVMRYDSGTNMDLTQQNLWRMSVMDEIKGTQFECLCDGLIMDSK